MSPNSPTRAPQPVSLPQPTLAPSPAVASGTTSRPPPFNTPHRAAPPPPPVASSSKRPDAISSAKAYANAHTGRDRASKPIFEWITRKLTAGRRATIGEAHQPQPSNRVHTLPRIQPAPRGRIPPVLKTAHFAGPTSPHQLSPIEIFSSALPTRDSAAFISRAESHSLRSYSLSFANSTERERRREANNPYPSIPVQPHRASTVDSVSVSFLTRSRTPSLRSEASAPLRSMLDDGSSYRPRRWADEDASVRPIPPSHTASPTHSTSMLSRSASASLLIPNHPSSYRTPRPPPEPRPAIGHSASSSLGPAMSFTSSDPERDGDDAGRQSRQDSTSTKPTTVLSFDSGPHVAHIATAPPIPSTPVSPTSPPNDPNAGLPNLTPTTPPAAASQFIPSTTSPTRTLPIAVTLVQAPKHTHPHPRDNPRPSSPPGPNASTLTLASSTFGLIPAPGSSWNHGPASIHRLPPPPAIVRPASLSTSPSVTFAPDRDRPVSVNEYPPSAHALSSMRNGGWGRAVERDASTRAIRRKGSWESYESGWSWRAAQAGEAGYGVKGAAQSPPVGVNEDADPLAIGLGAGPGNLVTREKVMTAQTKLGAPDESPVEERRFDLAEPGVLLTA